MKEGPKRKILNLNLSSYFEDTISIFMLRNILSCVEIIKAKPLKKNQQRYFKTQASGQNLGYNFDLGSPFRFFPEGVFAELHPPLAEPGYDFSIFGFHSLKE